MLEQIEQALYAEDPKFAKIYQGHDIRTHYRRGVVAVGMSGLAAAARIGLVVAGVAAIGIASLFEPARGTSRNHAICTGLGAITIAVWPALVARQESVLAAVGPRRTLTAIVVSIGLLVWTAVETHNGSLLGLAERLSSGLQVCWPLVMTLMIRRAQPLSVRLPGEVSR